MRAAQCCALRALNIRKCFNSCSAPANRLVFRGLSHSPARLSKSDKSSDPPPSHSSTAQAERASDAELRTLNNREIPVHELPKMKTIFTKSKPLIDWIILDQESTSMKDSSSSDSGTIKPQALHSSPHALPSLDQKSSPSGETAKPYQVVSIDTTGLFKTAHEHTDTTRSSADADMTRYLTTTIKMRGPIPVATYMRECLTNPKFGYYMRRDVFGQHGDFITSPEISQMFGELLAVWCIDTWQKMGEPSQIRLVELGPGRGTLMRDVLRVAKRFKRFCQSAFSVHFVEVSPHLRGLQAAAVGVELPESSKSREGVSTLDESRTRPDGIQINWHPTLKSVPEGPTLLIAQEFFDALPVHRFEFTTKGWREILVDININKQSSPYDFRYVISPVATAASSVLTKNFPYAKVGSRLELCPEAPVIVDDIAARLRKHGGGALLIDYGEDRPLEESLRAIKNHKFVDLFECPGEADLSALVDFGALRTAATKHVSAYGPITQGEFLQNLGIETRLAVLLRNATDEQAQRLISSYERLISPQEMGATYKVLALAQLKNKVARASGFESA